LLGLIPFFPGGANVSGNIAFTLTLAVFTFFAINLFGNKHYWKEILTAPGTPLLLKILLVPIELIGLFTKPFALMLRLFANITAGHIIVLSLTSVIFVLQTVYVAPLSILLSLMIFSLEFLVALLQAYIFTLLAALFIGLAVNEHH
jgi:F-type H+-transporting ATPase subunit a